MLTFRYKITVQDIQRVREISESTKIFDKQDIEITASLAEETLELQQNPEWRDAAHTRHFLLAELDGEVCAYVCYGRIPDADSVYEIYWLATDKKYQGQGIGRQILQEVIQHVRQAGGTKIYLKTDGRASYKNTQRFYHHFGFEMEARLKEYYSKNDDCCIYSICLV